MDVGCEAGEAQEALKLAELARVSSQKEVFGR